MPKAKKKRQPTFTGKITSVTAVGAGPNSAELVVVVEKAGSNTAFHAVMSGPDPKSTEPQVFSAMAAIATAAYVSGAQVLIGYEIDPGRTHLLRSIQIPA